MWLFLTLPENQTHVYNILWFVSLIMACVQLSVELKGRKKRTLKKCSRHSDHIQYSFVVLVKSGTFEVVYFIYIKFS